jgi:conjugative relaxase-like TrwC/TraI family protein
MSLHVLNAGTGYLYYTSETASADELRGKDRELGDYYTARGLPPGRWVGSGIDALGLSGNVTEEQMANLYGEGVHPERDHIIAEKLAAGWTQENAEKAAKLGRAYYKYQAKNTVLAGLIREREAAFMRLNHRPPTAVEKRNMRSTEAAILFRVEHGRAHATKEELGRFITSQLRPQQEAVAGFDLTFTPVKSISVLWAIGGEDARRRAESIQDRAVQDTISYLEKHAIATRKGANGIAQESIESGIIAGSFRHYDSRSGDPNIHDHVVIANKVQDRNGHWKTIDSKLLHRMSVAASEFYNARTQALWEQTGARFEARTTDAGKQPVMELVGIPQTLNEHFSTRSEEMKPVLQTLVDDYETIHGHAPNPATLLKLAQAANLETRPDKSHGKSLEQHTTDWTASAHTIVDKAELRRGVDSILNAGNAPERATIDVSDAAAEVIAAVSDKRTTWSMQHVMAEANRWSKAYASEHGAVDQATVDAVIATALDVQSVALTPSNPYSEFKPLDVAFGANTFEHATTARFTSHAIIKDENYLIRAGNRDVIPAASIDDFNAALDRYNTLVLAGEAHPLDPAQLALAREFATSGQLISNGLGGAGTGKSTVMSLVKDTLDIAGNKVIALGPSAVAAGVIGDELGITASTLDMFVLASGPNGRKDLRVTPGTVVIIDEAGMAGTAKLARAVEIIEAGGGLVRPIGDPHQHSAVQAGGAFSLLVNELGAIELDTVHRFRNADGTVNEAEAAASLALRTPVEGEANPFQWYLDNGRIQAGNADIIEALAFTRWQGLVNEDKPAIILATTNDQARRLSEQAQAYRIQAHRVDATTPGVTLRDGTTAWVGDVIVTRKNNPKLKTLKGKGTVRNGDLWDVERTHADGTLTVTHQETGGRIRLPADYIQDNVHLGYAYTGNRGQGMTRDYGIPLGDASMARNAAYPALTRGRYSNELFLILEPGQTRDEALARIAANHGVEESAHAAITSEYARINDLSAMAAQYRYVDSLANTLRMEHLAREVLGDAAEEFINAESFGAVATHLAKAEDIGWDAAVLLKSAHDMREFDTAKDNSAVLAWRIETIIEQAPALAAAKEGKRPLADLSDAQLRAQLATADGRVAMAETALADAKAMHGPHPRNHWTNRVFGHLTDQSLETRLTTARLNARTDVVINDSKAARKNAWEIRALANEITIRARLRPEQWAEETIARGSGTRAYGQPQAGHKERLWQNKNIAAALRAEERYRALTPCRSVEESRATVTDRLPEWLAPSRASQDPRTPEVWAAHLAERRGILAARYHESGHSLTLEAPAWAQALGPVPAREDLNQAWRDTAAEIQAFRAQYKVLDTETVPVPERFREQALGAELHTRAVAVSRASHNAAPATAEQLHAAAAAAVTAAEHAHAGPSPARMLSDMDRREHGPSRQDGTGPDLDHGPDGNSPSATLPEPGTPGWSSANGAVAAPPQPVRAPAVPHDIPTAGPSTGKTGRPSAAETRPLANLSDTQLAQLAQTAEARLEEHRTALDTARQEAWAERAAADKAAAQAALDVRNARPYGRLTDGELEARISTGRLAARESSALNDAPAAREHHEELRRLRTEHATRLEQSSARPRTGRENAALAEHRDRYFQSRTVAAQIRAEQRRRLHDAAPKATDATPEERQRPPVREARETGVATSPQSRNYGTDDGGFHRDGRYGQDTGGFHRDGRYGTNAPAQTAPNPAPTGDTTTRTAMPDQAQLAQAQRAAQEQAQAAQARQAQANQQSQQQARQAQEQARQAEQQRQAQQRAQQEQTRRQQAVQAQTAQAQRQQQQARQAEQQRQSLERARQAEQQRQQARERARQAGLDGPGVGD